MLLYIADYALMCAEQFVLMSKHHYQTGPPHGSSADAFAGCRRYFCLYWKMEVAAGLEPAKIGFADRRLGLFGIATKLVQNLHLNLH